MRALLPRCPACLDPASTPHFPLCTPCANSRFACPPLPLIYAGLDGAAARDLLTERWYEVLKRWKVSPGVLLERLILNVAPAPPETWLLQGAVCAPIPQERARSWELGHQPSATLTEWISRAWNLPEARLLDCSPAYRPRRRQAQSTREERLNGAPRFIPRADVKIPRVAVLVDDFLTTGGTLSSAATLLKRQGVERVYGWCLGYRPARPHQTRTPPRSP